MRRFVRLNEVLECIVEYYIMQSLRAENIHLDVELSCDHRVVIHALEYVEDDLMIAHIEHALCDPESGIYSRPRFTKVELSPAFPPEPFFNIEYE